MAINALIAQGIRPIGADVPEVGNMLQQMKQREVQNALAQQQAASQQQSAAAYQRQVGLQADQRQAELTQQQYEYAARAGYALSQAKTPQEFDAIKAQVLADPQYQSIPGAFTADQMTPENVRATLPAVFAKAGLQIPKGPEPITLGRQGGFSYLTQGGNVIPGSVDKPQSPANPPADMYAPVTLADGTVGAFDKRRGTIASTGQQAKPTGNAANPMQLRKEFDQQQVVKDFKAALPVLISARRAPDNGAGDLDVIYAVGKTLDPGSVVREGELTLVIKSGTMLSQMFGAGRFQLGQGGRISPEQRQQLLGMLNERVGAYRQSYDQARQQYSGYAQESGFKPEQVVGPHPANAFAQPKPSKPAPPSVPPDIAAILQKHGSK